MVASVGCTDIHKLCESNGEKITLALLYLYFFAQLYKIIFWMSWKCLFGKSVSKLGTILLIATPSPPCSRDSIPFARDSCQTRESLDIQPAFLYEGSDFCLTSNRLFFSEEFLFLVSSLCSFDMRGESISFALYTKFPKT